MTTIQIFDPSMCCSTGICGPEVDPKLVRFAADLDWLQSQGITIERFNLSKEPLTFAQDAAVKSVLDTDGEAGLPLIKINGDVKSTGIYPTREELAAWLGIRPPAQGIFTDAVAELVAIGAAIAANCEPCFKYHYDKARKLGVTKEDMWSAVTLAQKVKESPAKAVHELARRYLIGEPELVTIQSVSGQAKAESGGCCSSKADNDTGTKTSCCE